MTALLFRDDPYLKSCEATVIAARENVTGVDPRPPNARSRLSERRRHPSSRAETAVIVPPTRFLADRRLMPSRHKGEVRWQWQGRRRPPA
ncbi:MAG: hypothetical protein ACREUO_02925, partial [Burkholderiales bacterium]